MISPIKISIKAEANSAEFQPGKAYFRVLLRVFGAFWVVGGIWVWFFLVVFGWLVVFGCGFSWWFLGGWWYLGVVFLGGFWVFGGVFGGLAVLVFGGILIRVVLLCVFSVSWYFSTLFWMFGPLECRIPFGPPVTRPSSLPVHPLGRPC